MKTRVFGLAALVFAMVMSAGQMASAQTYQVDPVHSMMVFRIKHMNIGYIYGRFNNPTGTVSVDANDPAKTSFHIEVETKNVDTGNPKRDDHLRGSDFFNAVQFPKMSFQSKEVKKDGDNYEVTGDLTIKGVTKSITVTINKIGEGKDPSGATKVGFETNFVINRNDFGVNYMPGGLGDEVHIAVAFEAGQK